MSTPPVEYQWRVTGVPRASSRWDDIWFLDPDTGWGVNSNGQIWKTEDGGANWELQFRVTSAGGDSLYLRSVHFANATNGWVGTTSADRRLFHTADGGTTWELVTNLPSGPPFGICGLSVVGESVVYGSGFNDPGQGNPGIIKTTDGGVSWTSIDMSPHANNLIDIFFVDEQRGWVVGGRNDESCQGNNSYPPDLRNTYGLVKPVVLYTENGGQTWVNQVEDLRAEFACGSWGWKIQHLNEQVIFVSVEDFFHGAILKTTDGGKTWVRKVINDTRFDNGQPVSNANLEGIGFINEHHGWVGGWGDASFVGIYNSVTRDGGNTWTAEDANTDDGVTLGSVRVNANRFRFFSDPVNVGYCSGLQIYKLSIEPLPVPTKTTLVPSFALTAAADPSRQAVNISYTLPRPSQRVTVHIWNAFGVLIRHLTAEQNVSGGAKVIVWDGRDDGGNPMHPGCYLCRLTVDDDAESIQLHLG